MEFNLFDFIKNKTTKILQYLIRLAIILGALFLIFFLIYYWVKIYEFLITHEIFSAIIISVLGGISLNYIWEYIMSEHKRYNNVVNLSRIFLDNYNSLINNRSIIREFKEDKELALHTFIFHELVLIDKERLLNIKYLNFLNDSMDLIIKTESYNKIISEYKRIDKEIKAAIDKHPNRDAAIASANEAYKRHFKNIGDKTDELIDKLRSAHSKADTIAKEDKPFIIHLALFTLWVKKGGKEIKNIERANKIENILKHQDEVCHLFAFDSANEKCNKCDYGDDCEKYCMLKL